MDRRKGLRVPLVDRFRRIDPEIRARFHAQPEEKKKKSLAAKSFILYPFEIREQQKKPFEEKEAEAVEFIADHLKMHRRCYVATSFGMDSIVLMSLAIRAAKLAGRPIPDMWLNNTLNVFKEEKQYWKKMIEYFGIQKQFRMFTPPQNQTVWTIAEKVGHLPDFRRIGVNGRAGNTPECCDILKKESMKSHIADLPEDQRYDCHFIGTRAEESQTRSMDVLQRCRTSILKSTFPYPIRVVKPLSFWTFADISEYYKRHGIPKNPAYAAHNIERMGCASCPAHKLWERRLAKDPTNEGLGMLKMNLKILARTEPDRLERSLDSLQADLKSGRHFSAAQGAKIAGILEEYGRNCRIA